MRCSCLLALFLLLSLPFATSQIGSNSLSHSHIASIDSLVAWRAGSDVSSEAVARFGLSRCFAAEPLSDSIFALMQGKSYKQGCPIRREELRYVRVLHYDNAGHIRIGELVCNKKISADLVEIFRQLYESHYAIERMLLIDNYEANDTQSMLANNTSCFNYRRISGSNKLSNHSHGCAIDINPLYNPHVIRKATGKIIVNPSQAHRYANRSEHFPYKITRDDLCYQLFRHYGFTWGGDWKHSKDYQHFEKQQ